MLKLNVTTDFRDVNRYLDKLRRELVEIKRRTVNSTAFDVRTAWQKEMAARFNRPTKWPGAGVWVTQANRSNLTATIALKQGQFRQDDQLRQQFVGGTRRPKKLEVWLRQQGFLAPSEYIVPGRAAPLDTFGNVRRAWQSQIMQQLRPTSVKPTKRKRRTVISSVFWADGKHGLRKGAWARGKDGKPQPLLLAVSAPQYRALIALKPLAEKVVAERAQKNLDAAFARVMGSDK